MNLVKAVQNNLAKIMLPIAMVTVTAFFVWTQATQKEFKRIYEEKVDNIELAAKLYADDNLDLTQNKTYRVTLKKLISSGYVPASVNKDKTGYSEFLDKDVLITKTAVIFDVPKIVDTVLTFDNLNIQKNKVRLQATIGISKDSKAIFNSCQFYVKVQGSEDKIKESNIIIDKEICNSSTILDGIPYLTDLITNKPANLVAGIEVKFSNGEIILKEIPVKIQPETQPEWGLRFWTLKSLVGLADYSYDGLWSASDICLSVLPKKGLEYYNASVKFGNFGSDSMSIPKKEDAAACSTIMRYFAFNHKNGNNDGVKTLYIQAHNGSPDKESYYGVVIIKLDKSAPICVDNSSSLLSSSLAVNILKYGYKDEASGYKNCSANCNEPYYIGSIKISSSMRNVTIPSYTAEDNVGNKKTCPSKIIDLGKPIVIDPQPPKITE